MFRSIPTPLKMAATGGSGIVLMAITYGLLPRQLFFYIMIGTALMTILMGLLAGLAQWHKQRKAKPMEKGLKEHGAAAPTGLAEPARRARLDDLRRNFEAGVEKFRAAGKNVYSLPWYVLVGEPGSGKTEAIRHCNVGFPPGLQDPLQGVGGTINMNWWFTNHAVILDTAGRLMFEEVEPGTTNEWREFLRLLRASRPNCPINGMLLCMPADSLIKDTAEALERKGAKIAQQLDQIQRALGVRFPVFVMVTKCDLINGFREFFEDITDPQLQHQMLGWSNPAPLDQPFNPELVTEHLRTVVQRLYRRRLGLLLDPVNTEDPSARRTDQVDALYAFPQALMAIAPRLRRYLEMIFVAGEWSAKPLFLRGIYFTSSMREGSALDAELAEALGMPVESLPEGRVWERERAYFLRDLFMNKVFREKGLVTSATHAKRHMRRRKGIVLGAGFLSVIILAALTWWGFVGFNKDLVTESDYWLTAAEEADWRGTDSLWRAAVELEHQPADYAYRGMSPLTTKAGVQTRTVPFLHQVADIVRRDVSVPWIFRFAQIFGQDMNRNRRRAQRVLYESCVLRPTVDAARNRIAHCGGAWSDGATDALQQLLLLEAQSIYPGVQTRFDPDVLFRYVLTQPKDVESYQGNLKQLREIWDWTYSFGGAGQPWPPALLACGREDALRILDRGVEEFIRYWETGGGVDAGKVLGALLALRDALGRYGKVEQELLDLHTADPAKPGALEELNALVTNWQSRLKAVHDERVKIDKAAEEARIGGNTLVTAYDTTVADRLKRAEGPHRALINTARPPVKADPTDQREDIKASKARLSSLADRLEKSLAELEKKLKEDKDRQDMAVLDPQYWDWVQVRNEDLRKKLNLKADEHLRLLDVRLRMYGAGDAQVAAKDSMPGMEGLAPAVEKVRLDTAEADKWIGILADLKPGAFRFKEASDVSRLASSRLARRKRIYAMVADALAGAPKSAQDVGAKVAAAAKGLTPIPQPYIPGTKLKKGEGFAPTYHPKGAADILAGWYTVTSLLDAAGPASVPEGGKPSAFDIIKSPELAQMRSERQAAYDEYRQAYVRFWSRGVLGHLECDANSWDAFCKDLVNLQVPTTVDELLSLGKTMQEALGGVPPAPSREGRDASEAASRAVAEAVEKMKKEGYLRTWKDTVTNWKALGADPEVARGKILPLAPAKFVDDYLPFPSDVEPDLALKYWRELTTRGLELLAGAIDVQVTRLHGELVKYALFPLGKPRPQKDLKPEQRELTWEQLEQARSAADKVLGAARLYEPGSIGAGARLGPPWVNQQLDRLCGKGLDPVKRAWCERVKSVLDGLPPDREPGAECVVRLLAPKDEAILRRDKPPVIGTWTVLRIFRRDVELGAKNTDSGPVEVAKVPYPATAADAIVFKFFLHPMDKEPNRTKSYLGPWAVFHLLHERKGVWKDGKKWHVELVIPDDKGDPRSLWIELEFAKPLPKLEDWPGYRTGDPEA